MSNKGSQVTAAKASTAKNRTPVLNYSLRPAKNIERKMMGEAFARLAPLQPLSSYRYIGFGSEFFNDFALYHETLGIKNMMSIEHDVERIPRCQFNRPYKCIKVSPGKSADVLSNLKNWKTRTIFWLDYVDRLNGQILDDVYLTASAASSGSLLVWSVNANPWDAGVAADNGKPVTQQELPQFRLKKLTETLGGSRSIPTQWLPESLAKWGLASVYYKFITTEISRALGDRNASVSDAEEKIDFRQCFHFHYADGQRMLTVGGLLLNKRDSRRLGSNPFNGLAFVRESDQAFEIRPPILTGREVRHLNKLFPHSSIKTKAPTWLDADEIENFRQVYRYYPIYAESEL